MSVIGQKRKRSYEAIVAYAILYPLLFQSEIAKKFHTSQARVSRILCRGGIRTPHRGGIPIKHRPNQSDEQHKWETLLHDMGLGMDRGLRVGGKRIYYGFDFTKETGDDESSTCNSDF
jgi:hypothetical protein